jgi:AmmeMemoRadiSam system protein B
MSQVKQPAVAGLFYPDAADRLQNEVDHYLLAANAPRQGRPHALVAPHAGYRYSGPVAASAYAQIAPWADSISRVVVLAPSHRVAFRGMALSSASVFATPLGELSVDRDAVARIAHLPGVGLLDAAFAEEHALEVQLPFLQRVLGDFLLVPIVVGQASTEDVARVLETLYDNNTLIVVSSDLSHYHQYAECRQRDRATSDAIAGLDDGAIGPEDACGAYPLRGLLTLARHHGWHAELLDLRNSGDTSGDRSRVVGYGAYAFY